MSQAKPDYSKQPITDVPAHILEKVSEEAERYFREDAARLLGAYDVTEKDTPEIAKSKNEARKKVLELSTHTKVTTPERRALHKKIILEIIGGRTGMPEDVKPPFLLFAGPPGAGKSNLREKFKTNEELGDKQMEQARRIYQENIGSCISIDFNIFKNNLPEYKAANTAFKEKFGDMYAVIRSEASGLNQAIRQFAKEANLGKVQEQIFDVDLKKSGELDGDAKQYDMTVFGVTCDPEVVRARVKARKNPMQDAEVSRAINGFSNNNAFGHLANISDKTFLIDTNGQYKTVFAAKNGKETYKDKQKFQDFKNLVEFHPQAELSEAKGRQI